jgi:hypothetical protein
LALKNLLLLRSSDLLPLQPRPKHNAAEQRDDVPFEPLNQRSNSLVLNIRGRADEI